MKKENLAPWRSFGDSIDEMQDLHRNNLAEWIMWLACVPLMILMRAYFFVSSRLRGSN